MAEIRLYGDNLLLKKVEPKKTGEFEVTGDVDPLTPLYIVHHTGDAIGGHIIEGTQVLLKPGSYNSVTVDGVQYTFAERSQIIGRIGK
jgi:hypothetical protein